MSNVVVPLFESSIRPLFRSLTGRDARRGSRSANRYIRFGALGDSITRNMYTPSSSWAAEVGEVINYTGRCWAAWACQLTQRKCFADIEAFEGYSGYRTDQVLNEMLPASNTRNIGVAGNTAPIPYGVLAASPDYCFVMLGTNDLSQGVSIATATTNLKAIWAKLRLNGIEPIAISMLPRNAPAEFASAVPTWNTAIQAAASQENVLYIDVYTNCNNGSGAFKTGWTYIGGIPDPTGLHPGNEACHQMATDIATSLMANLPLRDYTPYVNSSTEAIKVTPTGNKTLPLLSNLGGGLFPTAVGWGARFETGGVSIATVGATSPAQLGNALQVAIIGIPMVSIYSDRTGPQTVTVIPGKRYAFFARIEFTANNPNDECTFGIGNALGYPTLWLLSSGGDQGVASTNAGASLTSRDVYHEFTIPPGITEIRPWIQQRVNENSAGIVFRVAQLGTL